MLGGVKYKILKVVEGIKHGGYCGTIEVTRHPPFYKVFSQPTKEIRTVYSDSIASWYWDNYGAVPASLELDLIDYIRARKAKRYVFGDNYGKE